MRYFPLAAKALPNSQATIYYYGAPQWRLALPGPDPARQLGHWLRRQAAANPDFAGQVRSILLLTADPPPASYRALQRALTQLGLHGQLRLQVRPPSAGYPVAPAGGGRYPAPALLDELLGELENRDDAPDSQPPPSPRIGYREPAPLPPPPTPAELAAIKAQQQREEEARRLEAERQRLEEERRLQLAEQERISQLARQWQAAINRRSNRPRPATWQTVPPPTWQQPASAYKSLPPVRVKVPAPGSLLKTSVLPARTQTGWKSPAARPPRPR